MPIPLPQRGEIWWIELEPVRGHEQGGTRPGLVISNDIFNSSPAELVVIVPVTSKAKPIRSFLQIHPPEAGLRQTSYIICDQVRTISRSRLTKVNGRVSESTLKEVERRLKILMDLS